MKRQLATYVHPRTGDDRVGLMWGDRIVDVSAAYAGLLARAGERDAVGLAGKELPPAMLALLQRGDDAWRALDRVVELLGEPASGAPAPAGPDAEPIVFDAATVKLRAPVPRPGKIIHTAGNFREHAREGSQGGWEFQIPPWISFLKCTSSIIGPDDDIVYPELTEKLDHEIELAIVIGKGGRYIPPERAWEHIAGFTVFNDISARDLQAREMKSGLLNLGKNLDTFAPFGPCMTLRDDIGDVHDLKIELRVNGDPRQVSSTNRLSVKIPEIVSHWSVMRLEPGDIISTGTVSGVAAFRPDPTDFWLKPGDLVECEIENIGTMRNRLVADELTPEQRSWLDARRSLFASDQTDEFRK
ncbi:Ureidoglycolate lyase [Pigmentiphaga humi]|uniref:Ureidoglycolate lyase n=1 Tax=Pigmentiphaga humi TaxID=2478468 RepID=A0A3P4B4E3_9BURK|nr:fumarylacetoacetate hydrolase family protein [Pigmentiphaga humi]VCU70025.1 Ureidoglycolate lyase [Pigmentiphaga humi]